MLANAPQQVVALRSGRRRSCTARFYSNRQLEEELVDFWFNHFNVFLDKGADRFLVPTYEREAIRPHVLGHFRDLLEATATSPAMLFYLDNWQSVAPETQSQAQRQSSAARPERKLRARADGAAHAGRRRRVYAEGCDRSRALLHRLDHSRIRSRAADSYYNDRVHDKGEKIVLGVTIPAGGGKEDGEKVLDILAAHPSTAKFISTRTGAAFRRR